MIAAFLASSLVVLAAIPALPLQAAEWTVDSNAGRPATFRTLQEAHDSPNVSNGDTLYLLPSSTNYGSLVATKRLNVFGPGYLLHQNLSFSNAVPSALVTNVNLQQPGASGSLYAGLEFEQDFVLNVGVNNITIKRNFIRGFIGIGNSSGSCENISILQNFVSSGSSYGGLSVASPGSGVVRGNFIAGQVQLYTSGVTYNIQHNVVGGDVAAAGSSFLANNLIAGTLHIDENASADSNWSANIFTASNASSVSPHLWTAGTTFADQFLGTGSLDGRWRLKADAAVIGTGKSGATPGMFSGPDPYVLSGLPSVPMVVGLQAPSSASASTGLPVSVTLQVAP